VLDIVLVPTYSRPEYLHLCLEAISKADGGRDKAVWIARDCHKSDGGKYAREAADIKAVIEEYGQVFAELRFIERAPHSYYGNSFNTLELYREAFGTDAEFVYLIEDDVIVESDFFRWHEAVQGRGSYFCSIARYICNDGRSFPADDSEAYIESTRDYASLGVCFRRENLKLITRHCCDEYYRSMTSYIVRTFPNSWLGSEFSEQDGLIQRVIKESGMPTAWACLPRAYHIGIHGYHRSRGARLTGSLTEKIRVLKEISQTGKLKDMAKDFKHLDDIDTPRGYTPAWNELRVFHG
jgi:hypothetical protein